VGGGIFFTDFFECFALGFAGGGGGGTGCTSLSWTIDGGSTFSFSTFGGLGGGGGGASSVCACVSTTMHNRHAGNNNIFFINVFC
jgi:hypothetical protein